MSCKPPANESSHPGTVQDFPDVAAEWHPALNGSLRPSDTAPFSNKKAWWLCSQCDNAWEAIIGNRTRGGRGCPLCARAKRGRSRAAPKPGRSLADVFPDVAAEWHPTRNGRRAEECHPRSGAMVWWICAGGHEWEATVANRTGGRGCGRCNLTGASRSEIEIFAELRHVLQGLVSPIAYGREARIDRQSRERALKPDMIFGRIIVEFDGARWHSGQKARSRDLRQTRAFRDAGFQVLRIRESPLEKIEETDVRVGVNPSAHIVALVTLDQMRRNGWLPDSADGRIALYRAAGSVQAGRFAKDIIGSQLRLESDSLAVLHPEVAAEWHSALNGKLSPQQVKPGSNRKAWWRCATGHVWEAVIASRTSGNGCPYCSGRMSGYGSDLASQLPDLIAEWDFERNEEISPDHISPGSHAMVWWKCSSGHRWQAEIRRRALGKSCPYCVAATQQRGSAKHGNTLARHRPDLAAEWHPTKNEITPDQVSPGSDRKVWWRCKCGHEWAAAVGSRSAGSGCPPCGTKRSSIKRATPEEGESLADLHPELLAEWNHTKNGGLTPDAVRPGSSLKVWWRCSCGHEWDAVVMNRSKGVGCPRCARDRVSEARSRPASGRSLADLHPELVAEWNFLLNPGLDPGALRPGSNVKVSWICGRAHVWSATISSRVSGTGCKKCADARNALHLSKPKPGRSLAEVSPEIAAEWHPDRNGFLTPGDVAAQSNKKRWWRCAKGHEWESTVANRAAGRGCRDCGRAGLSESLNGVNKQVVELIARSGVAMRTRAVNLSLGEPEQRMEATRARLKRLVRAGWLAEPATGHFTATRKFTDLVRRHPSNL